MMPQYQQSKYTLCNPAPYRNGVSLIELLVVVAILGLLLQLLLPAVRNSREAARKITCSNNLRQIGIALNGHLATYGHTPHHQVNTEPGPGGKGMFNSLVFLLPGIEQQELYDRIDFSYHAPYWTSKENNHSDGRHAEIAGTQVESFLCPLDPPGNKAWVDHDITAANNSYVGNVGWPYHSSGIHGETGASEDQFALPNGFLSVQTLRPADKMPEQNFSGEWRDIDVTPASMTDGLSKTVAYSERLINKNYLPTITAETYPPPDLRLLRLKFTSKKVLSQEEHFQICDQLEVVDVPKAITGWSIMAGSTWFSGSGEAFNTYQHLMPPNTRSCTPYYGSWWVGNIASSPSSYHPGGVNTVMADGSVHFIADEIDRVVWWALGSRNAGDIAQLP
ncbi:MAG: DUF1559 domain-containing protein [Pseudomonadota bacterium]